MLGALLGAGASFLMRPKKPKLDVKGAIARFRGSRPSYTLSPDELAVGERARAKGTEAIGQGIREARGRAARSLAARGIGGAPLGQITADIEQGGSLARAGVNRDVGDLLESIRQRGLDFERQKEFTAFGAEMGDIAQQRAEYGAQSAAFWNSAIPLVGQLSGLKFPTKSKAGGGLPPTFDPHSPIIRLH